jgi:hypothetical protein
MGKQLVARWAHIRQRRTSVRNTLLSKIYLQIKVNNIWNRVKADYTSPTSGDGAVGSSLSAYPP